VVEKDMWMHPSSIIANRIRMLLSSPMLADFLEKALSNDDKWACNLVSRIAAVVEDSTPSVWEIGVNAESAPAYCRAINEGKKITLVNMLRMPRDRKRKLLCVPLMHLRGETRSLLPEPDLSLQVGDRLLFCGRGSSDDLMRWGMQNDNILSYLLTGKTQPEGTVWKWLTSKG
jgi:hypothetical protein